MELIEACWNGDVCVVRRCLEEGGDHVNVNVRTFGGLTALGVASYRGHADVVDLLMDVGEADPCEMNLRISVMELFDKFMRDLEDLRRDASTTMDHATQQPEGEESPLHIACRQGQERIVQRLTTRIGGSDGGDYHSSSKSSSLDVNQVSGGGATPLYLASRYGHADIAKVLLWNGANADHVHHKASGDTALTVACAGGHVQMVQVLVEMGHANVNARNHGGLTSLDRALRAKHKELVCYLVSREGAVVNGAADADGWTALHFALAWQDDDLVNRLLHHNKANVNAYNRVNVTPLHSACTVGSSLTVAHKLLDGGANINARDNENWTPLHRASYQGHMELVRLLVDRGATMDVPCHMGGMTPLAYAIQEKHIDVARFLLERGAEVHKADKEGWTPLHLAIKYCPLQLVPELLRRGADANAYTETGLNSLHLACIYVRNKDDGSGGGDNNTSKKKDDRLLVKLIGQLLNRGADPTAADNTTRAWTPLHYAMEHGNAGGCSMDVVQLLLLQWVTLSQNRRLQQQQQQ